MFVTLVPWIELRGSIPFAILVLKWDPVAVLLLAWFVNCLVMFPVYFLLSLIVPFFERFSFVRNSLQKIHEKSSKLVKKYGFFGLMVFVGIPLPGTGVYAGTIAAFLLGMKKRRAFTSIAIGAFIAAVLVTIFSSYFNILLFSQL